MPVCRRARAQATSSAPLSESRLILLGSGGGPRPRLSSMSTAQVILANGVPRQLVRAAVALAKMRHTRLFFEKSVPDIDARIADGGRPRARGPRQGADGDLTRSEPTVYP